MRLRSSIFTQVWLPYSIIIVLLIGILAFYYPNKQRQILSEYKRNEINQLASTLSNSVELSLAKDDFGSLQSTMQMVSKTDQLSVVGLLLIDGNNKTVSEVVIPDTVNYNQVIADTLRYLTSEKSFSVNGVNGRVFISISKAKMNADVSNINRPIFLFLTLIAAVIMILVYFLANMISNPITRVQEFAESLSKGNYNVKIAKDYYQAKELDQLQISLYILAETLDFQRNENEKLTHGLEEELKIRSEKLLQAMDELNKLSLVAKKTSNAVIITDQDKKIQWVNQSAEDLTGYSLEELIGKTPGIFQSPKSNQAEIARIGHLLRLKEPVWAELLNQAKDGREYWVSLNIVPMKNDFGEHTGFLAVETDVTERKNLELQREVYVKQLEESRAEINAINAGLEQMVEEKTKHISSLALFPEQNPNPVFELQLDESMVRYFNPAAGATFGDLTTISLQAFCQILQLDLLNIQVNERVEFEYNGLVFERNIFLLENGKVLRGYLHNITLRKQNEKELSKLIDQLRTAEQDLTVKTVELERSLEELKIAQSEIISKERLSTLGMLIAGIAHEINTPLGSIKASGENMKHLFNDGIMTLIANMKMEDLKLSIQLYQQTQMLHLSTSEEREYLQRMMERLAMIDDVAMKRRFARSLVQMGILTPNPEVISVISQPNAQEILQLSLNFVLIQRSINTTTASSEQGSKVVKALNSFAHGNLNAQKSHFNLRENIETVLTIMWNKIKQGSHVVNNIPDDVNCFGLPDEMSQVWTNLVNNALQAANNKCNISFEYHQIQGNHVIEISNNGPQIPEDIIDKIFEPFFTTKARGEGTGLGLNIVRKIIEKQGGTISCLSDTHLTKFTVTLPIKFEE
ncbi:MAG: PAS domain S-box protein [Bacteroidetes bacterium]|nr:PAS domain S-box protein [Bacteroidota bacterium]